MDTTVIIGNGVAGTNAAAALRKNGYEGAIKLIGEEVALPYQRPPLSKIWLREPARPNPTPIRPLRFFEDNRIELMRARKVVGIDRTAREIRFSDGKTTKFDTLILATGASPRRLDMHADLKGVHYLRGLGDSAQLRGALTRADCRNIAIIGAGVIGLEVASAAIEMGKTVTVIESAARAMARVASPATTNFVTQKLTDAGVQFLFNRKIEGFGADNHHVSSVNLSDGAEVKADLVFVGIGAAPNVELAQAAGLDCDNGICVDEDMRTSDPGIFAIGDCARSDSKFAPGKLRMETVHNATTQAQIAAAAICNKDRPAPVPHRFWSDLKGMKVQAIGIAAGYDLVRSNASQDPLSLEVHLKSGDRLVAAEVVNLPTRQAALAKAISPMVSTSAE
ncbi:NAD(P)/FAD-dependent oxidoreductase [Pontivivens nitratireducens]|uniref:FAD-dependent oxidoreductase n=1 Tax=Pontivivens nitratireducens TaxID=2758038 RepID=A0A6G7VIR6_9RHOB|nr:FAD-dependent oxidoreductase [Pontibrevibacter nitratireducens]QIK39939.1 FAD-dependent oxidoreductase [Pontibrevibacter nitratireducens]